MGQLVFDFTARRPAPADGASNDYHVLPISEKQLRYARQIAERRKATLPQSALADRKSLSQWIDANKLPPAGRFENYPSSKQVAFAERIARIKRRAVPDACFKDRTLMSRWIDSNR